MQTINHWPDKTIQELPETVSQDLYKHLLEPFEDESEAKEFWEEAPSTIIILEPLDTIKQLEGDEAWRQIEFTLTYPEYTVSLKMNYQLMLAIANDSGCGIYLVIPSQLSHLIP
jgi:hypothetical protein